MLHLCYSNRFEELAAALVRDLEAARAADPDGIFATADIVVPNQGVATYLELAIARASGIAANLRFPFLQSFLAGCSTPNANVRVIDRNKLHALLCGVLADDQVLTGDDMAPLRRYLEGEDPDALGLRRFQLAGQLATLFDEYAVSRHEMVTGWRHRLALTSTPQAPTEAWQRRLWLRLFGDGGLLESLSGAGPRWVSLPQLLADARLEHLDLPDHTYVVGFPYVARGYHGMFHRLARSTELHLYSLNPCREFWEDSAGRSQVDADDTPALRLWGRPGRENVRALNGLAGFDFEDRFVVPDSTDTLLGRLQADILSRAPETEVPSAPVPVDDSIRIHACPGIQRELEIIGNQIWSLIKADDSLRFNDIAILINRDELDIYQAHIGAVFGELHDIPHNVVDVPLATESRIVEAFELLLALPFGNFTRPELLRLLTHPSVLARYPDIDPNDWVRWSELLGIVHGADHDDHDGTYITRDIYNWDQGIRRLALGAFMSTEPDGAGQTVRFGGSAYLPLELPRDELSSAARFALLARSVIADARYCRDSRMRLADWRRLLDFVAQSYLCPTTDDDQRNLSRCRDAIASLADIDLDGRSVGYRTASEFVGAQLSGARSGGQLLADGVCVAPLAPMRALPFRVVFMAGLGEGRFPTSQRDSPLDLRSADPHPTDVSPRDRDRYLFLETLLSARERLYLSYVSRHDQTGEQLQPSSVVMELRHLLARSYVGADAVESLTIRHPLRRYDRRYFPDLYGDDTTGVAASVAPAAREQARALALRRHAEAHYLESGRPVPDARALLAELDRNTAATLRARLEIGTDSVSQPGQAAKDRALSIPLSMVRRFLESPLQAWASVVLGLRENEFEDLTTRQDEPFGTSPLLTAMVLRDVFTAHLDSGRDEAGLLRSYRSRAALLELSGALPTGLFSQLTLEYHQQLLKDWWSHIVALGASPEWSTWSFGRASERRSVGVLLPAIVIPVELPGGERLRVELYGRTEAIGGAKIGSLVLATGAIYDKHRLRGYIDQLALAAAGVGAGNPHRVTVIGPGELREQGRFAPISAADAQAELAMLLGDLLGSSHAYLLPCEAVFKHHEAPDRSHAAVIDRLRSSSRVPFSSRFGPVSRLDELAVPASAADIAARRFAGFFDRYGANS